MVVVSIKIDGSLVTTYMRCKYRGIREDISRMVLDKVGACQEGSLTFRIHYTYESKGLQSKDPNELSLSTLQWDVVGCRLQSRGCRWTRGWQKSRYA